MPNLRTILEELVKDFLPQGELGCYSKKMIDAAEQKIKELMLSKEEIDGAICEWLHLNKKFYANQ